MKKRICFFLAILMLAGLLPVFTVPAFASNQHVLNVEVANGKVTGQVYAYDISGAGTGSSTKLWYSGTTVPNPPLSIDKNSSLEPYGLVLVGSYTESAAWVDFSFDAPEELGTYYFFITRDVPTNVTGYIVPAVSGWDPMVFVSFEIESPPPPPVPPSGNVIVDSTTSDSATIDLTTETVNLAGFKVAAYSVNGGTKWKKGPLPEKEKFAKLFNKELTLWLSDTWIDKAVKADPDKNVEAVAKGVPDTARIVQFPAISKRPKKNAEKLKPYYGDTNWGLAPKNGTETTYQGYEYAETSDGKTPKGSWLPVPEAGFAILTGTKKETVLFRSAPSGLGEYKPASAPFKVKPANFGKAPNYKIKDTKDPADKNIKIKVLAFKKGDQYAVGDEGYCGALTDKLTIPIAELGPKGMNLFIRKAATGKKPPTAAQVITLTEGTEVIERVLVTVESDAAGVTFRYSMSSAAAATTGISFTPAGIAVEVGHTIYVYARWIDAEGVWRNQTITYPAVQGDVEAGKKLIFSGGTAMPTFTTAAISTNGMTITVTFPETVNAASAVKESFVLGGAGAASTAIASVTVSEDKATLTLTAAVPKNAALTINLAADKLPTYGSGSYPLSFAPRSAAFTIVTGTIVDVDQEDFDAAIKALTDAGNDLGEIATDAEWAGFIRDPKRAHVEGKVAAIVGDKVNVTVTGSSTTPADTYCSVTITSKTKPSLTTTVTVTYTIGN